MSRLDAYYSAHGRVAILLEPDPAPSFSDWLRPRGFEPRERRDRRHQRRGQSVGGGPRTPLGLRYHDHPVTRGFEIATMYDGARPMRVIERPEFGGQASRARGDRPSELRHHEQRSGTGPSTGEGRPRPADARRRDRGRSCARPDQETRLVVVGRRGLHLERLAPAAGQSRLLPAGAGLADRGAGGDHRLGREPREPAHRA